MLKFIRNIIKNWEMAGPLSQLIDFMGMIGPELEDVFTQWLRTLEPAKKRPHFEVAGMMEKVEPIFEQLGKAKLPYGAVSAIAEKSKLNYETLRDWRTKLLKNPEWRPYRDRNRGKQSLSPEFEARLADKIRRDYILQDEFCPLSVVKDLAHQIHDENLEWDEARQRPKSTDFKASYHWCFKFLRRNHLSLRKYHTKRRPGTDDFFIAAFYDQMNTVFTTMPRDRIINVDETCWRALEAGKSTVAERGAESVTCHFDCDEKLSLTAICAIDASGGKLPIWILAKGTSTGCEDKFYKEEGIQKRVRAGKIVIHHTASGWTNSEIAVKYVQWLSERFDEPVTLIWDVFSAHRSQEVKTAAREANVQLRFIPAGMTDRLQPLDFRIFGDLKSRARARFDRAWAQGKKEIGLPRAALCLAQAWESIESDSIVKAWAPIIE